jgi:hypothetical protein
LGCSHRADARTFEVIFLRYVTIVWIGSVLPHVRELDASAIDKVRFDLCGVPPERLYGLTLG